MRLSDLSNAIVVRDAEFGGAGLLLAGPPCRLVVLADRTRAAHLQDPDIGAVVTSPELAEVVPDHLGLIVSADPFGVLAEAHRLSCAGISFHDPDETRIDGSALVHPTAVIAERGVVIGPGCRIGPRVVLEEGTLLERDVMVGPGSVLGLRPGGSLPAVGGLRVMARVEIQANAVIHRALYPGETLIGSDVKIDNLVTVGWNSSIDERAMIVATATLGNGVRVGADAWIGPGSTIADDCAIGPRSFVTLGSLVTRDIPADRVAKDNFILDRRRFSSYL